MEKARESLLAILLAVFISIAIPVSALGADKLLIKDGDGETVFKVTDTGGTTIASRLYTNGASAVGAAPYVLGQDTENRGIVITDKAATNPKRIYFGWNVGTVHEYAEIFGLQEGVGYKNLVLNPNGGRVGIGTSSPSYPLQMGSGAYVSSGGVWTNASSREYKTDIRKLSTQKAIDALKQLDPVEFAYKTDAQDKHVGFIAEDAPELVASKDKKGMSSMDVVAVLTKVVQEQQRVISEMNEKIVQLQAEVRLNKTP
ncbi:MAG: tail fiber domain-containing protein [Deltaproteobacteria bacterium]|uniref:Tail fiber domain-containing protein n=1 Tax=Candidatus Desulfacyla euxinica TaxID=2841693 RepID=A0A8J6T4W7_9DELT|nr:tail fiber domain-containing protein [Candidatus Desulfacyla euxinica]MBL7217894.1 tail fiber domain-containing protein [Desulfobacteraceae bacterium]